MSSASEKRARAASTDYQLAVGTLRSGNLALAISQLQSVIATFPDLEQATFAEEQILRLRANFPARVAATGFDAAPFEKERRLRRAHLVLTPGVRATVAIVLVAFLWQLLFFAAPRAATLGRAWDVPLIFRLMALAGCVMSGYIVLALSRLKWEGVTIFILWSPAFLIATFIALLDSPDSMTKALLVLGLGAQAWAAWYVSNHSYRFPY